MSTQPSTNSADTSEHRLLAIDSSPTRMYRWRCSCGSTGVARVSKLIAMKAWDEHVRDFDEWRTRHGLTKPAVLVVPAAPIFRRRPRADQVERCSGCKTVGQTWPCLACGGRLCDVCDPTLESSPELPCISCTERHARSLR